MSDGCAILNLIPIPFAQQTINKNTFIYLTADIRKLLNVIRVNQIGILALHLLACGLCKYLSVVSTGNMIIK